MPSWIKLKAIPSEDLVARPMAIQINSLFVFSINDPEQNARSLLTPVFDPAFHALSHGSLGFSFHGSFFKNVKKTSLAM